jgi:hypothetical protein
MQIFTGAAMTNKDVGLIHADELSPQGNLWQIYESADGNDETKSKFAATLRRVFDRVDVKEIKECIVKYTETIELIYCRCVWIIPTHSFTFKCNHN